jgi:CheY-like chemotaxis protein
MQTNGIELNPSRTGIDLSALQAHSAWLEIKRAANADKLLSLAEMYAVRTRFQGDCALFVIDDQSENKKPLIAVVDDEPVIAITLAEIISRHGFEAVWFTDPVAALDLFRVCDISLLLSDVTMRVMDGISLAVNTLQLQPECSILLLSGKGQESELCRRVSSLNLGIHFEAKPIPVQQLLATVHMILSNAKPGIPTESLAEASGYFGSTALTKRRRNIPCGSI